MIHSDDSSPVISRAAVFDGDDTLWDTMPLYEEAKRRYYDLLSHLGWSEQKLSLELEERDRSNVEIWGFGRRRLGISMVEVYRIGALANGTEASPETERQILAIANRVFVTRARDIPGAAEALSMLRPHYKIILLTKGDDLVQKRRLRMSNVASSFEHIYVVRNKDKEAFRSVLFETSCDPRTSWSIGDSIRSDINPALELGMSVCWLPRKTWAYEQGPLQPSHLIKRANSLFDVPEIVIGKK